MSTNGNFKVKKIFEELRKKILEKSDITEINDKELTNYIQNNIKFCSIKIKRDLLEIDFRSNNTLEDPMDFSWKIKSKEFDRRMQLKNIAQIDTVYGLIIQSYQGL